VARGSLGTRVRRARRIVVPAGRCPVRGQAVPELVDVEPMIARGSPSMWAMIRLYHHPFTDPQKRRAIERGWKLTVEVRVEEGVAHAAAEFTPVGPGFPIQVRDDGDREIVRLSTRAVPDLRGLEFVPGARVRLARSGRSDRACQAPTALLTPPDREDRACRAASARENSNPQPPDP